MVDEGKSGMRCEEFEALLAEAVDGTLSGQTREEFERHRAGCAACNTLLAEVTSGAAWLDELVDAAPPRNLVHNILAVTSGARSSRLRRASRGSRGGSGCGVSWGWHLLRC